LYLGAYGLRAGVAPALASPLTATAATPKGCLAHATTLAYGWEWTRLPTEFGVVLRGVGVQLIGASHVDSVSSLWLDPLFKSTKIGWPNSMSGGARRDCDLHHMVTQVIMAHALLPSGWGVCANIYMCCLHVNGILNGVASGTLLV
jgi:hypothetical protein